MPFHTLKQWVVFHLHKLLVRILELDQLYVLFGDFIIDLLIGRILRLLYPNLIWLQRHLVLDI
jgi:hypothetical protein